MAGGNPVRCAVLGAGSFGTCLAVLLADQGYDVALWARAPQLAETINRRRRNPRYLSDIVLPDGIRATHRLEEAVPDRELVLSVIPSHGIREVWSQALPALAPGALVVSATKGIERGTGLRMSQILGQLLPAERHAQIVVLSGPSFAHEIAAHQPTSVCVAAEDENWAVAAQAMLSSPVFRCYSNPDVIGVELGGALKNVIAIAVGCADGMGMGMNTRAALITRGLAEMRRLGEKLGARPATFSGLSGAGDLILTCTGALSRNRSLGIEIGKGRTPQTVLSEMSEVAEGFFTAQSAWEIAQARGVEMPITEETYRVLHEGKDPRLAIRDLMTRQLRSELE